MKLWDATVIEAGCAVFSVKTLVTRDILVHGHPEHCLAVAGPLKQHSFLVHDFRFLGSPSSAFELYGLGRQPVARIACLCMRGPVV